MYIEHVVVDETANGDTDYTGLTKTGAVDRGWCQTKITGGTVTIEIKGRLSTDFDWEVLHTSTSNDLVDIPIFPLMRVTLSSISGATVDVGFGLPIDP
jgi:hypothetical protein